MELANRVKYLRKKNKLTQSEFADLTGFSHSYIQKFEEGKRPLNTNHLIRFSKVLRVNPFDIIKTENTNWDDSLSLPFELKNIEYRKKSSRIDLKNLEKDIMDSISENFYRLIELENILGEKVKFNNPIEDLKVSNGRDVENAVKILRKKWKLGQSPIYDCVYLLEKKGVRVFEVEKHYDFVGFSGWAGEVPLIVLNVANSDISRRRFTALHELAHLVLAFEIDDYDKIEKFCNHFAGAMLLTEEVIREYFSDVENGISLQELKTIKTAVGISIQAILLRAKTLNYIDWDTYHRWRKEYDRWVESEDLGRYESAEKPRRFFHLLAKAINDEDEPMSLVKASELSGLTVTEIETQFGNKNFSIN